MPSHFGWNMCKMSEFGAVVSQLGCLPTGNKNVLNFFWNAFSVIFWLKKTTLLGDHFLSHFQSSDFNTVATQFDYSLTSKLILWNFFFCCLGDTFLLSHVRNVFVLSKNLQSIFKSTFFGTGLTQFDCFLTSQIFRVITQIKFWDTRKDTDRTFSWKLRILLWMVINLHHYSR